MTAIKTISAEELKQRDLQDGIVLDVRTGMEHDEQRLVCPHVHVPLDWLNPAQFMQQQGKSAESPVYILCRSGGRATKAAEKFADAGFNNVYVITGGIQACAAGGHETESATPAAPAAGAAPAAASSTPLVKMPMSMERQVRVAAGIIVALGAFLGLTSGWFFTFLTMLAGGALAYSGVTGDCRMALLLAKAPWNQGAGGSCATGSCATPATCSTEAKAPAPENKAAA